MIHHYSENLDKILSRLKKVKQTKNGYVALCPAHDDKHPSLSVTEASDRILIHCFANCRPKDILYALGLEIRDLFPQEGWHKPHFRKTQTRLKQGQALRILEKSYQRESVRLVCELGAVLRSMEKFMSDGFWLLIFREGENFPILEKIAKAFFYLEYLFWEVAPVKKIPLPILSEVRKAVLKWKQAMKNLKNLQETF